MENKMAARRYGKAETAVWWDMNVCPVPEGYDASLVGPCIDRALQKLGYSGPLSITAVGNNLKRTPDSVLQKLSSSGIVITQTPNCGTGINYTLSFWGDYHPPPATVMLISDYKSWSWMYPILTGLQEDGYNLLMAYPQPLPKESLESERIPSPPSPGWVWKTLLADHKEPFRRRELHQDEPAPFSCTLCRVSFEIHEDFTSHLHGEEHELNEYLCGPDLEYQEENVATIMTQQLKRELKNVVVEPRVDDSSLPKNKAMVWWDIDSCAVPPDYNACLVGPRIKSKFKNFGFSGTLTITAIGTLAYTEAPVLCGIASTGINVKHVQFGCASIIDDVLTWATLNPPPAKIMLISSGTLLERMSPALDSLVKAGYHILVAYPDTLPKKASHVKRYMKCPWETLLAADEKKTLSSDDEPETRVEMGRDASIICSTCDLSYQSFESFDDHFNDEEHEMQAFRTCYYYLNQEPGSGSRYAPAVKELSKEGLNISSFLMKLTRSFRKSKLNKQVVVDGEPGVGSSCLSNATVTTTTMAKKQPERKLKKRRTE